MTPEALADLHARAFAPARGWSAAEFAQFTVDPACVLVTDPHGFALARVTQDEAELLSIAADVRSRRRGIARKLLTRAMVECVARGAERMFLEVAEDNAAARALYDSEGFDEVGRRREYYPRTGARAVDALILLRHLA